MLFLNLPQENSSKYQTLQLASEHLCLVSSEAAECPSCLPSDREVQLILVEMGILILSSHKGFKVFSPHESDTTYT